MRRAEALRTGELVLLVAEALRTGELVLLVAEAAPAVAGQVGPPA